MNTPKMSWEHRIKDDRTVQEWNMQGKKTEMHTGLWWENLKEEGTLEEIGIAGSMILKQTKQ